MKKISFSLVFLLSLLFAFSVSASENGTPIQGIYLDDVTYTKEGSPYYLTDNIQINEGVTVRFEEGAVIQGHNHSITSWGNIEFVGTEEENVILDKVYVYLSTFSGQQSVPKLHIDHALVLEGALLSSGNTNKGTMTLLNSTLSGIGVMYMYYPPEDVMIKGNIFHNAGMFTFGVSNANVFLENNVFFNDLDPNYTGTYQIENWAAYNGKNVIAKYNSFLSSGKVTLSLPIDYSQTSILATENYWGTVNESEISDKIFDRNDDLRSGNYIEYKPYLLQPHEETPPFLKKQLDIPIIKKIYEYSDEIQGSITEPLVNATILLRNDKDEILGSIQNFNGTGDFNFPISKMELGEIVRVQVIDEYGNTVNSNWEYVLDGTPPSAPIVDSYEEKSDSYLTGTTEQYSTVKFFLESKEIVSIETDQTGHFHYLVPQEYRNKPLEVIAIDIDGNKSSPVEVIAYDTLPPYHVDLGSFSEHSDFYEGYTDPNVTITILNPDEEIGNGQSDQYGYFKIPVKRQLGNTKLTLIFTDGSGNSRNDIFSYVTDLTAPLPPVLKEYSDQSTHLEGTGEAGATAQVLNNRGVQLAYQVISEDSTFKIPLSSQKAGTVLTVKIQDASGNSSEAITLTVLDRTLPTLTRISDITEYSTYIYGTTEKFSTVQFFKDSILLATYSASEFGNFSGSFPRQDKNTKLQILITDVAGNKSEPIEYTVYDTTPPATPYFRSFTEISTHVKGTTSPGVKLEVFNSMNELLYSDIVPENGNFNAEIGKQPLASILKIVLTSQNGYVSNSYYLEVTKRPDLYEPSISTISNLSTSVWGGGISGGSGSDFTVKLLVDGKVIGETISDGEYYNIEINPLQAGTIVEVIAYDEAGKPSPSAFQTVQSIENLDKPTNLKYDMAKNKISGNAQPYSKIAMYINNERISIISVGNKDTFSITLKEIYELGTSVDFYYLDEYDNRLGKASVLISDTIPPVISSVFPVFTNSTEIVALAEESSSLEVRVDGLLIAKQDISDQIFYHVPIDFLPIDTVIEITALDTAGNRSKSEFVTVTAGPELFSSTPITTQSTVFSGKTWPYFTVKLTTSFGDFETVSNESGDFNFGFPNMTAGTRVTLTIIEPIYEEYKDYYFTVGEERYTDLKPTHWAYDAIIYLGDNSIISGYPDGTFQPDRSTTRAEAARMLATALELEIPSKPSAFKDVANTHWAKDYINAVYDAGIFSGDPSGTFRPSGLITRAEMAVVLSLAYDLKAENPAPFKDVAKTYWANKYIAAMYENALTVGYSDNTYRPTKSTTRAEFSLFLAKALNPEFK